MGIFVYIAKIKEYPNLVKIGCSINPHQRAIQLSSSYGLKFSIIHKAEYVNAKDVEAAAHNVLSRKYYKGSISDKRETGCEIFTCSKAEAIRTIEKVSADPRSHIKRASVIQLRKMDRDMKEYRRIDREKAAAKRMIITDNQIEMEKVFYSL